MAPPDYSSDEEMQEEEERLEMERQERIRRQEEEGDDDDIIMFGRRTRRTNDLEENVTTRQVRPRFTINEPDGTAHDEDGTTHDDDTHRIQNLGPDNADGSHPTFSEGIDDSPPTTNTVGIVATLKRLFPHGFPNDRIIEDLRVQANIKGDGARMAVFRVEALQHQELTAFGFLQQKDMTIHIIHSAASYHARGATGPLKGKDIAFVGDRTNFSSPAPVVLQPEKPWKWITNKFVTDDLELAAFYANPSNINKFYTPPPNTPTERLKLPRLLLLPCNLLHFCAAGSRTPLDLLRHVHILVARFPPDTPDTVTPQDYDLVLRWCCAALHGEKGDSLLSYDVQAAVGNDTFLRWTRARIDCTFGLVPTSAEPRGPPTHDHQQPQMAPPAYTPQQPPPPQQPDLSNLALLAAEFGKGVMAALHPGTAGGLAGASTTTTREYDVFQQALLQGFAHTPTPAGLPPIWSLFCQSKSTDTHRLHIREAMNTWARNTGVTINRGMYLSKVAIDDIITLRFNPGGSAAYYSTAEKGISILLCRSKPGEDRESARQQELAEEISSGNRTLSEAITLHKSAPRAPPDTYNDLKASVATFCALVWALFGNGCEYFQKLYEVYLCLDSDRANEDWANFTPLLCRQITWAIIDDGREYFAQTMLPVRFHVPAGTLIRYPQSSLEELIRPIRTQSPILRANFPVQWLPRMEGGGPSTVARQLGTLPSAAPLGVVTVAASSRGGASLSGRSTTSSITQQTVKPRPKEIRATDIHPLIKKNFEPHYQRFGQLQLVRIMKLAGVTWPQMPKLDKYTEGTANKLCYNYVLGRCTTRYCSHKNGHAPVNDVTLPFANDICNLLLPGIRTMTEALMDASWPDFQALAAESIKQRNAHANA